MIRPGKPNRFAWGFGIVMLLHIVLIVIFFRLPLYLIGVTQFLYVAPIAWLAYRRSHIFFLQGVLTAAGITVLIDGACYFMVTAATSSTRDTSCHHPLKIPSATPSCEASAS